MRIVVNKRIVPNGYNAITLYPFIIVREKNMINNKRMINHESIHIAQQKELLWLPFFILYGLEFVFRYFQYLSWDKAYRNISFEREAYANERDTAYLNRRKRFAFFYYIKNSSGED